MTELIRLINVKMNVSPRNCIIIVDLPEPTTFLIPASRYLRKFKAMARLMKLKHAINSIEKPKVFDLVPDKFAVNIVFQ